MLMNSFGVINNIFKAYFNISYYVIDWFMLIQYPGMIFATIVLILLTLNERLGFQKLFIVMITCSASSYAFSIVAVFYPHLFWIIYLGQFAAGFALQSSIAIFGTFATSWFKEHQVGIALSLKTTSMSLGCLLAFLLSSQLFPAPPTASLMNEKPKNATNNCTGIAIDLADEGWFSEVRWKFLCLYGVSVIGCIIAWIFAIIFVTDEPPTPPTIAQAQIRARRLQQNQVKKTWKKASECWNECASILLNKTVIYGIIVFIILLSFSYLEKALLGEISREIFKRDSYINKMAGYILSLFEVGGILGSIVAGKLTNSLQRHKLLLCVAIFTSFISMVGLTVGRFLLNAIVVFVFNTLLGVSLCFTQTPLFDMVLQDTYPKNSSLVFLIFVGVTQIGVVAVGEICRVILDNINPTAVLIFLCVLLVVAFIVSAGFIDPKFKRYAVSESQSRDEEDKPLLQKK